MGEDWRLPPESKVQRRPGLTLGVVALLVAVLLMLPAAIATGCADQGYCDDYSALQVAFRAGLELAPVWMLLLAVVAFFNRAALGVFAVLAVAIAVLSVLIDTDIRFILRAIGLANASGFVLYALPFAVAAVGASADLYRSRPSS